jgi:hypothetical protein
LELTRPAHRNPGVDLRRIDNSEIKGNDLLQKLLLKQRSSALRCFQLLDLT